MTAKSYQLVFRVEARRSKDTEALGSDLEQLFRQLALGVADELDSIYAKAKKRGGVIEMRARILTDRENALERRTSVQQAIEANRNLIDRIDSFMLAVFDGDAIVGFAAGEWKGWAREVALEELGL